MKREFNCNNSLTFLFLVFLVFLIGTSVPKSANAASYKEFRALLADIKEAVSKENIALALDLLDNANEMLQELETRPILDEEALRWDMAQLNLDRADSMQNLEQRAYFANESIIKWHEYIEWFGLLDNTQLQIIKDHPASFRIQRAVRQLGNAYMTRANIGDYSVRDLFTAYGDLPPKYLSSQAMNLWRNWLFRCPSWQQVSNPSLRGLREKFESDTGICREDWDDFYGFLEEWVMEQDLPPHKKKRYQRWLDDLDYALGMNG